MSEIRAAALICVVVHRLCFVGAGVGSIGNAISVVVEVGTAITILEAVHILWAPRAVVVLIIDAIVVVVRFRAAIPVLEAIFVFGVVRALICDIGDAVIIRVALVCRTAILGVGRTTIFRMKRAAVVSAENLVVIVV
ncbi:MAG: hypothetical protein GY811_09330 [Myxococcales bacterium]|nr:hypothetical protein [Myxococcales bacterium]